MRKDVKYTLIFVAIGLLGLYFSYNTFSKKIRESEQYTYTNSTYTVKINNIDYVYDHIENDEECSAIMSEITNTLRYMNIILEDVPRADSTDDYYYANKEAINEIYSLCTEEQFQTFYKTIKPIERLSEYKICNISNKNDKYHLELELSGEKKITIPLDIYIDNINTLECTSYWNKESVVWD